jgi:hypothetical protein
MPDAANAVIPFQSCSARSTRGRQLRNTGPIPWLTDQREADGGVHRRGSLVGASTKGVPTCERKRLTRVEVHLHIATPILVQPTSDSLLQIISRGLGRLIATHILGQSNMRDRLMAKTKQSRHNKNSNDEKAIK